VQEAFLSTEDAQPIAPDLPPVQQFAARAVRGTLGRSTDVDACVALVAQVDQLLEQAAQHLPQGAAHLACRAGCNFCCHLQVRVLPHEAIALFRYLQSRMAPARADRVRMKIREYTQTAQLLGEAPTRRACAFLIEGECSAYEVRPGACAAYHSVSKQRCEESFHDPALPSGTVALEALMVVALALEEGVSVALRTQGLSHTPMELHTAVAALLANPALIARWRAGRALLKSAPTGAP
jgi:Fe-S-cluster containining protein